MPGKVLRGRIAEDSKVSGAQRLERGDNAVAAFEQAFVRDVQGLPYVRKVITRCAGQSLHIWTVSISALPLWK